MVEREHSDRLGDAVRWGQRPVDEWGSPATARVIGNGDRTSLLAAVLRVVDSASEVLIVASFLVASPSVRRALMAAAERGVRIYVLTSVESALRLERAEVGLDEREKIREHERALVELSGRCLVRSAPGWHAKFVLKDPLGECEGLLLSSNLNEDALRRSPEVAVVLDDAEVRHLFDIARERFWAAETEIRAGNILAPVQGTRIPRPVATSGILSTVDDWDLLTSAVAGQVSTARHSVTVTSYQIFADSPVCKALLGVLGRDVHVQIVCHPSAENALALAPIADAGATVLGIEWMHAKFVDVDGESLFFSSQNIEPLGRRETFEVGLVLSGERATDAREWMTHWVANSTHALVP